MSELKPLAPSRLYQPCDLSRLDFADTSTLEPLTRSLAQERAMEAIELGVRIPHEGFNLYLMGSTGLGKHRLFRETLEQQREGTAPPRDWCYVANFDEPHRPHALELPPGRGRRLRQDMVHLVADLLNAIPAAFQSDQYNRRAEAIHKEFKGREEGAAEALGKRAKEKGIALLHTPSGYTLAPVRDGKLLDSDAFDALPEEEQERLQQVMEALKNELKKTMSQIPGWQRDLRKAFKALDREIAEATVGQLIDELAQGYQDLPPVLEYLKAAAADLVEYLDLFRQGDGSEGKTPDADEPQFNRYKVNLLVDNAGAEAAPVVYEDHPTYLNLLGRIEHVARMGTLMTDFTLIKGGALHRANGGFLILDALKVLTTPFAWDALKRVLKSREIRIESLERMLSLAGTTSLEPQPIPVNLKVALIGDRFLYYLLTAYDPEFGQLFKVAADFAEDMSRSTGNDLSYARFIATLQQRDGLRPLERAAVERVVERAARRAEDAEKLSLHVTSLLDLLQEADYRAQRADSPRIRLEDVEATIAAQRRRGDQLREHIQEAILRGTLMIDTRGVQLGRVNGLTVIFAGDEAFGMPTRISATARLGSGEVMDIQREVDQGGPIHSKGVFILSSYLARRFAKYQPLCLSASLAFEQTYGFVEGDSASAAELCALLSAIGDIPLKQSLAITGSVNQHGEVQAIGGVNEKIEGFFDICQARGLTGEHGVIMPKANLPHLMLRRDVVEAVEAGAFRIYAVHHVDEAMELFTGQPAGVPDRDGAYPLDSINGQVQLRLAEWFTLRQQIGAEHGRDQAE